MKTKSAEALIKKRHHVAMGYMAIRTQSERIIRRVRFIREQNKPLLRWLVLGLSGVVILLLVWDLSIFFELYPFIICVPSTLVLIVMITQ